MNPTLPISGGPVAEALIKDLAAASRILAAQGVVDGFGHVSMRHPDNPARYLMARSLAPAQVLPEDIIEYDLDSNACNANGRNGFLERFIHGEILQGTARSECRSTQPFALGRTLWLGGGCVHAGHVSQRRVLGRRRAGV